MESTIQSEKDTHGPCAQTLLLTDAPDCPTESATGSRQCYSLQCSLVHGSGRLFPTPLTEPDRRAKGNDIVTVHRTTYRSFTSSLLATQPQTAYVCHNSSINRDLQHAIKHIERPGESHEGVGRKKQTNSRTIQKGTRGEGSHRSRCVCTDGAGSNP